MIYILGKGGHAKQIRASSERATTMIDFDEERFVTAILVGSGWNEVICGVGDLTTRLEQWEHFKAKGCQFATIMDASMFQAEMTSPVIGEGAYIAGSCHIGEDIVIGRNVLINYSVSIGHGCIIGDHCIISPGVILCGDVIIGKRCQVGAGATILQGVVLNDETRVPAGTLVVGQNDFRKPVPMVHGDGDPTPVVKPVPLPSKPIGSRDSHYTDT